LALTLSKVLSIFRPPFSALWFSGFCLNSRPYLSLSVQSSPHGGEYLVKVLGAAILKIDFDRLCLGIKLGTFDEDVLQILVPAENVLDGR